jgi:hypothetical protein
MSVPVFNLSHACYMPCPCNPPTLSNHNNIDCWVPIMNNLSTNYEDPNYSGCFLLLICPPSEVQIFSSSAPCSWTSPPLPFKHMFLHKLSCWRPSHLVGAIWPLAIFFHDFNELLAKARLHHRKPIHIWTRLPTYTIHTDGVPSV